MYAVGLTRRRLVLLSPYIFIALIMLILPAFLASYWESLIIKILLYAVFAMSMNLLMGYTGYITFGHAAFWGIGAYTVGILVTQHGIDNFGLIMVIAIGAAIIVGIIFGFLALRTTGIYFALITLALAQMLYSLAYKWTAVTGGEDGLSGIGRPWSMYGSDFYYFILAAFAICFFLLYWIINSHFGHILVGIRENEPRMQALGYNVWAHKYVCYILAGLFAAIAGALFAYYTGYVGPGDLYWTTNGLALLMVLIGGRGALAGPAAGAVIVLLLIELISEFTEHWPVFVGIIFVLVVMWARKGIAGYLVEYWDRKVKRAYATVEG